MTDNQIINAVRDKGYPSSPDLEDTEILEAIATVKRDLKITYPLNTFGTFQTVTGQQVYDLFNSVSNPATSQGVFPDGIAVLETIWSPNGDETGLSVFGIAPFLQGLTLMPGEVSVYSFNTPTDWWMFDANWASFINRFGSRPFEHTENRPGSPIRLYPKPESNQTVFIRYKKYRDPDTFQTTSEDESGFLMLVEGNCCLTIARKLNMVAGVTIGTMRSDGKSALYWQTEANRKLAEGWKAFADRRYENGSPVSRS